MSTFCAVDDKLLVKTLSEARKRVVYVAPGISKIVAEALGQRFRELGRLDVTVILDPDDDVCRIGYGDEEGLTIIHNFAKENQFGLRAQAGLRIGILLADDDMLVWSPSPRSVEAPALTGDAPNGLRLDGNVGKQIAHAVAADGTENTPADAEIGQAAVTPEQVEETLEALKKNPPVPVDLARLTRVFSTKLEFVEIEVRGAKLSQSQLTVPNDLLNADVAGDLKELLETRLRAFSDLRGDEMPVPAFTSKGDKACDENGKQLTESYSESGLEQIRRAIEKQFVYTISGYGGLIEKERRADFEKRMKSYEVQMHALSNALRATIEAKTEQILDEAMRLILSRHERSGQKERLNENLIREELLKSLERTKGTEPKIKWQYKGITFEHTQNADFRSQLKRVLPPQVQKRLGDWDNHFHAATVVNDENDLFK